MSEENVEILKRGFDWIKPEIVEVRDLENRMVALGRLRIKGKGSGAEAESPAGWVVDLKNGKAVRVLEVLDPAEVLEAAGLRE
jgi:hypothetical protein